MFGSSEKVFISYSRKDIDTVRPLVHLIKASGGIVFMDLEGIPYGEKWRAYIEKEIDQSERMLVFWSKNAVESEEIKKEYLLALKHQNYKVVPVLLDKTPLPKELAEFQAHTELLEFLAEDPFRKDLVALSKAARKTDKTKVSFIYWLKTAGVVALVIFSISVISFAIASVQGKFPKSNINIASTNSSIENSDLRVENSNYNVVIVNENEPILPGKFNQNSRPRNRNKNANRPNRNTNKNSSNRNKNANVANRNTNNSNHDFEFPTAAAPNVHDYSGHVDLLADLVRLLTTCAILLMVSLLTIKGSLLIYRKRSTKKEINQIIDQWPISGTINKLLPEGIEHGLTTLKLK